MLPRTCHRSTYVTKATAIVDSQRNDPLPAHKESSRDRILRKSDNLDDRNRLISNAISEINDKMGFF